MSLYQKLECSVEATKDEIKKSFKRLSLIHHPDKGGNETVFKEIVEAYETLSDDQKRKEYDSRHQSKGMRMPEDMFSMFMNFGNIRRNARFEKKKYKHPPTEYNIQLSLQDVMDGVKKKMIVKTYVPCNCREMCKMCEGEGMVNEIVSDGRMTFVSKVACDKCFTKGWNITTEECEVCQGNRQYEKQEEYTLDISAGVQDGSKLVFNNKGQQAFSKDEIAGDLIFVIKVEELKDIKIKGVDLEKEIKIGLYDSMIGKDIEIKYANKTININTFEEFGIIEKETEYRIKGQGICVPGGASSGLGQRGDLILKFKILYPPIEEMIKLREILVNGGLSSIN